MLWGALIFSLLQAFGISSLKGSTCQSDIKNISSNCFRFNWTKELKVVSTWRLRMQVASGDKLWNYFIVVALEAFKVCYLLSFVNLFFCYQKIILHCCISMTIPLIFARLQTINYLRTIVSDWITNLSVSSQCFYHAFWSYVTLTFVKPWWSNWLIWPRFESHNKELWIAMHPSSSAWKDLLVLKLLNTN